MLTTVTFTLLSLAPTPTEDEYKVIYAWNGSETVELWSDDMSQKISTGNVVEYSIDGDC